MGITRLRKKNGVVTSFNGQTGDIVFSGIDESDWSLDSAALSLVIASGLPFTNEGEIENDGERLACNEPDSVGVAIFGAPFTPTTEAQYFYVRPQAPIATAEGTKISFIRQSPLSQPLDVYLDSDDDGLYWITQGAGGALIEAGFGALPDNERVFMVRIDEDGNAFVKTLNTPLTAVGAVPIPAGFPAVAWAESGDDAAFIDVSIEDFGSGLTPESGDIPWIGAVDIPEVSAPALLTVNDAPTRYYGGNLYGPKSDTTPGVNHFGFLMPDGVTVIPLPDDAMSRQEVEEAIAASAYQIIDTGADGFDVDLDMVNYSGAVIYSATSATPLILSVTEASATATFGKIFPIIFNRAFDSVTLNSTIGYYFSAKTIGNGAIVSLQKMSDSLPLWVHLPTANNFIHASSAATSGTVVIPEGCTSFDLTGGLAATLTIDGSLLQEGLVCTIYSVGGVTALTLVKSGGAVRGFMPSISANGIINIQCAGTNLNVW